jgi:hypothetical protein
MAAPLPRPLLEHLALHRRHSNSAFGRRNPYPLSLAAKAANGDPYSRNFGLRTLGFGR